MSGTETGGVSLLIKNKYFIHKGNELFLISDVTFNTLNPDNFIEKDTYLHESPKKHYL